MELHPVIQVLQTLVEVAEQDRHVTQEVTCILDMTVFRNELQEGQELTA
jgi:hypothetical protein